MYTTIWKTLCEVAAFYSERYECVEGLCVIEIEDYS